MESPERDLEFLLLHLDAPLMSFGAIRVDELNETARFPYRSLLAGLIGNALGHDHRDADALQRLQKRIRWGARADRPGEVLVDYQTVDLGQEHLSVPGWTTRRRVQQRGKGAANTGTHIRHRHYLADAFYRVLVRLDPADEVPTLDDVDRALRRPKRPLFLGRKTCLPASRIASSRVRGRSIPEVLAELPPPSDHRRRGDGRTVDTWWSESTSGEGERIAVFQDRDWSN